VSVNLQYYKNQNGNSPYKKWEKRLDDRHREVVLSKLTNQLGVLGLQLFSTDAIKSLGTGLAEFRITADTISARVFIHHVGQDTILVLSGYSKSGSDNATRQNHEITLARKYLADFIQRTKVGNY
jgi:putative component of toxin-antitoxin plasmid stabilization module